MPFDADGDWKPSTSPKQDKLRELCRKGGFGLATGPRLSGKTISCLHCVADHAWMVNRANIAIITVSQTVGADSGIWKDFTELVLPEWIDAGFGMEWVEKPYFQNISKKPTCEVTNQHGGITTIQLESLKQESEVERNWKGRRYTMLYVPELSNFRSEKTFMTWAQAIRPVKGDSLEDELFLADTNPSDEGTGSWIYKMWFGLLGLEPDKIPPERRTLHKYLWRMDFTLADNIFDTADKIQLLKDQYSSDPDLYARYIEGKWVTASEDAVFVKVFRPEFHCLGGIETPATPDPEVLVPSDNCFELGMGTDPGVINWATVFGEKTFRMARFRDATGKEINREVSVFKVLDELVVVGEDFDLHDMIESMVKKMEYWEEIIGRPGLTLWKQWSDRSVFDTRVAFSEKHWHQYIHQYSNGKISLIAAERGPGSVQPRIDLFRKLLYEERVFFSRTNCPRCIEMMKSLKKGTTAVGGIAKQSPFKHVFDALTYWIASECYDELNRDVVMGLRKVKTDAGSLVQIGL